ncbi:MAG TPA: ABC transporter substrate-binding protein [Rubrivivax sp.]|nr:ABC transporter substrate-binding protein [Rubrivivax sp.]
MSHPNPTCPTTRRRWLAHAVGVLGLTGVAGRAKAAGEPIVVHHIGPFTGVLAASNTEAIEGARLALEAFNKRGGLGGRPVQLKTLDDGQDAKRSAVLLDELLAEGKLLALMMPRTTPSLEAMMPAISARGVPVVGPQTGASFVNQPPKREIFTLRASYQKEAERAIRLQHSVGVRRFGLVLADDAFGRDTRIGIDKALAELQIEPVAVARMDNRKADMAEPVNLLLAKQPQVVLLICSAKAAAEFIKGYRAAGASATFISLSNTSNNDYLQALGPNARGAIVMQVMPSPFHDGTPLVRDFTAAAAARKLPLSYAGLYGYASARLLLLGLQKAGRELTRASLIQALEGLGELDLGGLHLRYGPGDRTGSNYVDATIITQGGRFMR